MKKEKERTQNIKKPWVFKAVFFLDSNNQILLIIKARIIIIFKIIKLKRLLIFQSFNAAIAQGSANISGSGLPKPYFSEKK